MNILEMIKNIFIIIVVLLFMGAMIYLRARDISQIIEHRKKSKHIARQWKLFATSKGMTCKRTLVGGLPVKVSGIISGHHVTIRGSQHLTGSSSAYYSIEVTIKVINHDNWKFVVYDKSFNPVMTTNLKVGNAGFDNVYKINTNSSIKFLTVFNKEIQDQIVNMSVRQINLKKHILKIIFTNVETPLQNVFNTSEKLLSSISSKI